ncbi:MAG: hypothetical protein H6Q56_581, partial [Deltaproteobacteria bacterium]|nr:hypothetical protein [Deltaproteobacteria bacterium]
ILNRKEREERKGYAKITKILKVNNWKKMVVSFNLPA